MSESYEATFRWPHAGASDVIVTGTFDGWSCSHHLTKTPSGYFHGAFSVPWGDIVQYKYIVDGRWTTTDDQATELDPMGNLNNVLRAPARPSTPKSTSAPPSPQAETIQGRVNGFVETARQAVVGMVEALAPGTTETPAATPVAEKFDVTPEPVSAPEEPAPAPEEPTPAPEPSVPEVNAPEITSEAVLPSEPAPIAPEVPVSVLPLSTEPPLETLSVPVADVSESKPLETTIVEGSTTAETAVEPTPVIPVEASAVVAPGPTVDVSASAPVETTIVEGSTTAEAAAPAPTTAAEPSVEPSTHTPAGVNGASAEKPETNGAAPAVNGTNGTSTPKPTAARTTSTNGASPKTVTPPGSTGTSPATTPAKEKRMRFPSLSSRSLHSRSRSSVETPSELGESKEKNGTIASRLGSTERVKRRTSLFGKLKDVFHPKHETKPEATS
ncbi:hypothetical protein TRAPUB_1806 [Trametes pubescens]|uniref:AMP-activated protein kinase glycogen-binding domain-containing protein n=1 Tax=Trametes pubescens TaxID=154538 RepID=A0A1M2VIB5_TRAPU|nr:hypothetical protein TRAPUB_1806 [Trametes pubescens]